MVSKGVMKVKAHFLYNRSMAKKGYPYVVYEERHYGENPKFFKTIDEARRYAYSTDKIMNVYRHSSKSDDLGKLAGTVHWESFRKGTKTWRVPTKTGQKYYALYPNGTVERLGRK